MEEIVNNKNYKYNSKLLEGVALRRIMPRIYNGTAIKPCNYDEKKLGRKIISQQYHISFKNFPNLMNDEAFVLELARTSLNPLDCFDYFYEFVDSYLKRKSSFRYAFVCALFLNDDIYKVNDLVKIVDCLGLEKEYQKAKTDSSLKQQVKDRIAKLEHHAFGKYTYSGDCPKELRKYKMSRNDEQILVNNQIDGVKEILRLFSCLTAEEQREKDDEESWFESVRSNNAGYRIIE